MSVSARNEAHTKPTEQRDRVEVVSVNELGGFKMDPLPRFSEVIVTIEPTHKGLSGISLSDFSTITAELANMHRLLVGAAATRSLRIPDPFITELGMNSPIVIKLSIFTDIAHAIAKFLRIGTELRREKLKNRELEEELESRGSAAAYQDIATQIETYKRAGVAAEALTRERIRTMEFAYATYTRIQIIAREFGERYSDSRDMDAASAAILRGIHLISRCPSADVTVTAVNDLQSVPQPLLDYFTKASSPRFPSGDSEQD